MFFPPYNFFLVAIKKVKVVLEDVTQYKTLMRRGTKLPRFSSDILKRSKVIRLLKCHLCFCDLTVEVCDHLI